MSPAARQQPPTSKQDAKVLPGFEAVPRYWDSVDGRWVIQILPGEYCVSREDEVLGTVLGSCVAACIRDSASGLGGMNHFMLPDDFGRDQAGGALRYGCFAMERLLNELFKHGARRERLQVKVFGGGRVIAGMGDVGNANIEFVREYLQTEGIPIAAEDVGGPWARRLRYYPQTGRVLVKRLAIGEANQVANEERRLKALLAAPRAGSVELF